MGSLNRILLRKVASSWQVKCSDHMAVEGLQVIQTKKGVFL